MIPAYLRRAGALITALVLAASFGVTPAAAADPSVDLHASSWIAGGSASGGAVTETGMCRVGNMALIARDYRCALEFDLSGIPSNAIVTAATLTLRVADPGVCTPGSCPINLGGYAGDGTAALADLTAGSTILTFAFTSRTSEPESHDVTAFVSGLLAADAGWAGFNLSTDGVNDSQSVDDPPTDTQPILRITYSIPTPPQASPTPPPTSTDQGSGGGSSLPFVPLAMMLVMAMAGVVFVTRRAAIR
jgi:hypothetical protein